MNRQTPYLPCTSSPSPLPEVTMTCIAKKSLAPSSFLLAGLLLLAPTQALAQSSDSSASTFSPRQDFEAITVRMLAEKDQARQLAMFGELPGYNDMPIGPVMNRIQEIISISENPRLHFRALRWLNSIDHELGNWSDGPGGMQGPLAKQGCVTDFSLVGPFPNDSMNGFYNALPPELGEAGPYQGKNSLEIDWRTLPSAFVNQCVLNLDIAVAQDEDATILLATTIDSPKKRDARLLLAAHGSYKIWLDGKPVAFRKEDQGFFVDSDVWTLPLKKGKQQLVVKLASSEGNGFDLLARITDASFKPLDDLSIDASPSSTRLTTFDGVTLTRREESLSKQAEKLGKSENHHDALLGALLYKDAQPRNAATPWRDIADRLDAARLRGELDDFSAQEMMWLATLFEEQWKRLEVREQARAKYPDDPRLLRIIARTYARMGSNKKSLEAGAIFEQLVADHPDYLPGVLELADYWQDRGFSQRALSLLERYRTPENIRIGDYASALIRALETVDRSEEADALRASLADSHANTFNLAWHDVERLLATRQLDPALALIRTHRERNPWSTSWMMKEVEVLRAKGDLDGAVAILDDRLALTPHHTTTLKKQADLLVLQGKTEQAVARLQLVKSLEPQNQSVEDYIAYLQPDTNRYFDHWMIDDLRQLAKQMPAGPFHASTILQQKITRVEENGLSQHVVQHASRVNTSEGIDDASTLRIYYQTNDEQIDILSVRVLKPDGAISEDYDRWSSANSRKGSTTYNDGGSITLRANNVEVGDIVEFRYRLRNTSSRNFRGDYFGDVEYIQETTPIGMYRYAVLYPEKIGPLYFRAPSTTHERVDDTLPDGAQLEPGYKSTAFLVKEMPQAKTEANQPGYTEVYDHIIVSNKETIDELGAWWWNLVEEQLIVDDNIRKTVRDLTKDLTTDDAKVRAIHNYVVQNTRYLHVGLGIHGWKPYRTTTCFRNRYGDCKDKAALLKVMLEEAGIPANLVLVRTRRLGAVEPYPASMNIFNHAIAYVPSMDLFLDGTAEYNGTRELTTMDQSAQALVIEDGGKSRWVTMPVDAPDVNNFKQSITMDLSGEEPTATIEILATGTYAVSLRSSLEDPDRRDEVLAKQLAATYPGAKLEKATYSDLKKLEQPVQISATISGAKVVQGSDSTSFLYPLAAPKNLLEAYASKSTRDQDLIIRVPYTQQTTIKYILPADQTFAKIPQGKTLKSKFGSLQIEYSKNGKGELVVDATYSIDTHRVKVEDYDDFRVFVRDVTGTLNEAIELE